MLAAEKSNGYPVHEVRDNRQEVTQEERSESNSSVVITMIDFAKNASQAYQTLPKKALPTVRQIFDQLLFSQKYPHQPFVLVDYGAADGSTGTFLFRHIIDTNASDRLKNMHNVFITACATDFFSQCLPTNYVNFGFSSVSVHWLKECPCQIINDIFSFGIDCKASLEERAVFRQTAAENWQQFLLHRAAELTDDGHLLMINVCFEEKLCNDQYQPFKWTKCLTDIWQSLVDEGRITKEEFVRTNFPMYFTTREELMVPFTDSNSAVSKAGLRLVHIYDPILISVKDLFNLDKSADAECNEPELSVVWKAAAEKMALVTRSWSQSIFLSSLNKTRSEEEKKAIVDEIYIRLPHKFLTTLGTNFQDASFVIMHIQKTRLDN